MIESKQRVNGKTDMLMPHEIRFRNQDLSKMSNDDKKTILKQWVPVENPRFENWMVKLKM